MSARSWHRLTALPVGALCAATALTLGALTVLESGHAVAAATCAPVQIITVRGTNEPAGGSRLTGVARRIAAGVAGARVSDLPYPASMDFSASAVSGDELLGQTIRQQAAQCPQQRFVLLGFSQGAWVVGDALTGGSTLIGRRPATVPATLANRVAAIILYGDPRFTAAETFNAGTHSKAREGNYPRPVGSYQRYAGRIRSYCDADDQTCQNVVGIGHLTYWPRYDADAARFALSRLAALPAATSTAPAGTPATATTRTTPAPGQQAISATSSAAVPPQAGVPSALTAVQTPHPDPRITVSPEPAAGAQEPWWRRALRWLNPFD